MKPVQAHENAIAIVGMAFRFPGDACDPDSFWNLLAQGRCAISRIPEDRWPVAELQHPDRSEPGRSLSFAAGVLSDIDRFDAAFFGISPREATWLDPQQRLLLETAYEAMEDSGIRPSSLAGSKCGVYVGISGVDYGQQALVDMASMTAHSMTGNTLSLAANRISYCFDLHGPSVSVDTACSSSLVALHQACQALRAGEIPLALAGGVNILMHPYSFIGFSKAAMLSPKGQCRPFDAAADGYVRAEGGGLVLLKPLSQALADGNRIHALILASGVNADGNRKSGLTIPSAAAQTELMQDVLNQSGLTAEEVDFIEAHGTGTPVGDPVEAESIAAVYGKGRVQPLPISSVKANVGHLEPASGVAGLVKAVLCLQRGELPPMPLAYTPNPQIDFAACNLLCAADGLRLPQSQDRPLAAGLNSFGFGGVNAHLLLQAVAPQSPGRQSPSVPTPPLILSAQSDEALRELAGRYADRLKTGAVSCYDLAYSAALYRDRLDHRLTAWGTTPKELVAGLQAFALKEKGSGVFAEKALPGQDGLAFVYTGNGAQWLGMGRRLYAESALFRETFEDLDERIRALSGFSLLQVLQEDRQENLDDTTISQPLMFALQVGLTVLLRELGIKPQAVTGHSIGEIAAAWASGALTLEQAVQVICARSKAQGFTRGAGRMAAVGLSEEAIRALLRESGLDQQVEVAGINSTGNVTLSGEEAFLRKVQEQLPRKTFFRLLDLDYAFHSVKMDCIRETLLADLQDLQPGPTQEAIFISAVSGARAEGQELGREYWWHNVRKPVRFTEAIASLAEAGLRIFVEIGPHPILQHYIRDNLAASGLTGRILPTLSRTDEGLARLRDLAATLYALTEQADLSVHFPHKALPVPLPSYPWQRQRFWFARTSECAPDQRRLHPLLGWPLGGVDPGWENVLDPVKDVWLADHKVGDALVFPGAAYAEMALAAASQWRGPGLAALESLDISIPLVFEGNKAQCLRCLLNPADGTLRIVSRPRLGQGEWVLHATARVIVSAATPPPAQLPSPAAETPVMEAGKLYALTSAQGLDYGPSFRAVQRLRVADRQLEAELVPGCGAEWGEALPPAALDACFHSLVALQAELPGLANFAFLPVRTGRIERYAEGEVARIRGRVQPCGRRSLTADFELFDAEEHLLIRAEACRFRAAPLLARNRDTVPCWRIQPWLVPLDSADSVESWPEADPASLLAVAEADQANTEARERWYRATLPNMEALVLVFAAQAFRTLDQENPGWLSGVSGSYALWLRHLLHQEGVLDCQDGNWRFSGTELPEVSTLWREALKNAPDCLPALLVLARTGQHLPEVLRGERDAARLRREVLQAAVARTGLQAADPLCLGIESAVGAILLHLARKRPAQRRLRILDVASSPGPFPDLLGSVLNPDHLEYVQALPEAESRTEHGAVRTVQAGFGPGLALDVALPASHFDLVLLRHTLHRADSFAEALGRVRELLAPGGLVLLAERYPDWSADFVAGLESRWWREGADHPLSSLLTPEAWTGLLETEGFGACQVFREAAAKNLDEGAFLVLARLEAEVSVPERAEEGTGDWLFWADTASQTLAEAVAARLREQGLEVTVSLAAEGKALPRSGHLVFMRGFDTSPENATITLTELLDCVQEAQKTDQNTPQIRVITCEGALGTESLPSSPGARPAQCAVNGLGRVILNEYTDLPLIMVDVPPPAACPDLPALLAQELLAPADGNTEIALGPEGRFSFRVAPSPVRVVQEPLARCRLDFATPGRLRNLQWLEADAPELQADAVEVQVMATGLNFRDVMMTMGLLPDDAVERGFAGPSLGLEFAGLVTRTGEAVQEPVPGDRVMGFAPACFASHIHTPAHTVAKMPEDWSYASAATVPTVFFTAWYALKHLAGLQAGESVLIHGAAGGVGLAAIQIARHLGAQVLATAGSEEKRDFLRLLGVEHIFDSRSLSFADGVSALTEGQGVDVVLNSLAGESMRRSVALLKPFGRFLELGKRDFVENSVIGLRPFKENISYFAIDVDQLLTAKPQVAATLFQEIMQLLTDKTLEPLPYRSFPARQVVSAFRAMQQAQHIGKIVVEPGETPPVREKPEAIPEALLDSRGTWLVSGGLSGFGLVTARHLAELGVRHLVLLGRRGADTPGAEQILEDFRNQGVEVCAEACDVGNAEAVCALIARIRDTMPPLQGVVHAAAVFADQLLDQMDAEALAKVLQPKLTGAWNLHKATLDQPLSHFITYSSISVALGNPGQGNYVAANAGLEGLTRLRLSLNLPALTLAWGPVGDAGYLTRHEKVGKALAQRLGAAPLSAAQAMRCLDSVLSEQGVRIFAHVDWKSLPGANASPRLALVAGGQRTESGQSGNVQQLMTGKSTAEAVAIVARFVAEEVAQVLALAVENVDLHRSVQSMGLDSLMAVELAVGLEQRVGVRLPAMMLQDSPSVTQIAERIVTRLSNTGEEEESDEAAMLADLARKHAETLDEDEASTILQKGGEA